MNRVIYPIVMLLGFVSLAVLFLSATGYKSGSFELGQAFNLLRWSAYAGITSVGLATFYTAWKRPAGIQLLVLFISALAGLTAFYLPYRQQQVAQQVPPIHDITTNIDNPPRFVAVAPLRADAPNPAEYLGGETPELQREFYPDIMSVVYVQFPEDVFEVVVELVEEMGWELVDANLEEGRIEATAETQWFGFKDDVVIRLQPGGAGSTVFDMRSKSRVGRSDIGVNANRIRMFIRALNQKLEVGG